MEAAREIMGGKERPPEFRGGCRMLRLSLGLSQIVWQGRSVLAKWTISSLSAGATPARRPASILLLFGLPPERSLSSGQNANKGSSMIDQPKGVGNQTRQGARLWYDQLIKMFSQKTEYLWRRRIPSACPIILAGPPWYRENVNRPRDHKKTF